MKNLAIFYGLAGVDFELASACGETGAGAGIPDVPELLLLSAELFSVREMIDGTTNESRWRSPLVAPEVAVAGPRVRHIACSEFEEELESGDGSGGGDAFFPVSVFAVALFFFIFDAFCGVERSSASTIKSSSPSSCSSRSGFSFGASFARPRAARTGLLRRV